MTDLPTRDEAMKKLVEACHHIEQAACDAGSGLLDGLDPYDQIIKEDDWKVFLDALCAYAALPAEDAREKRREEVREKVIEAARFMGANQAIGLRSLFINSRPERKVGWHPDPTVSLEKLASAIDELDRLERGEK